MGCGSCRSLHNTYYRTLSIMTTESRRKPSYDFRFPIPHLGGRIRVRGEKRWTRSSESTFCVSKIL